MISDSGIELIQVHPLNRCGICGVCGICALCAEINSAAPGAAVAAALGALPVEEPEVKHPLAADTARMQRVRDALTLLLGDEVK